MIKRVEKVHLELLRRKQHLISEVKRLIFKSLIDNKNNPIKSKIIYAHKIRAKIKRCGFSRHLGLCALTGRPRGVIRLLGISRHSLKRRALANRVQNIKIGSW